MRNLSRVHTLIVALITAAGLLAGTAGPALADPPSGTSPRATDAVSVGDDTTQYLLDQLSYDYDAAHLGSDPLLYSWDAFNPVTGAIGDEITTKADCPALTRPNGSAPGIGALDANAAVPGSPGNYCIDFARSSAARNTSDPPYAPGGVAFVALAGDAVTWASRDAASGGTDAPQSLTTAQLVKIFECADTNWDQVGGKNAPIEAFLPQISSGTRQFFLTALGGGVTPITPGSCVSDAGNTLEENEGVDPVLDSPEAIFPYSVGEFIAQAYNSQPCPSDARSNCTSPGPCITDSGTVNRFGCDVTGFLQLDEVDGSNPATPWPLKAGSKNVVINTSFDLSFQRTLYDVVRYDPNTADHIPGPEPGTPGGINLEQFLGASGWACTSTTARKDIEDYGFLATWRLSTCGTTS
jgi:ABC-type phosphate transport system substrate-binding protein